MFVAQSIMLSGARGYFIELAVNSVDVGIWRVRSSIDSIQYLIKDTGNIAREVGD